MNVKYTDKVKPGSEGFQRLQLATTVLEEIVGLSASLVTAEWDRSEDPKGRPVYLLRLVDWSGEVSDSFTSDELQSRSLLRYRLIRLWGDLLQVRSHKQLEALTQAGDAAGE